VVGICVGGGFAFAQISAGPSSKKWQQVTGIIRLKTLAGSDPPFADCMYGLFARASLANFSRLGRLDWPADGEAECYGGNHDEALNVTHLD